MSDPSVPVALDTAAASALVREHVTKSHGNTFREPAGIMQFKYLVPSGFYTQLWDWDASHMGVGLLSFGGAPYLLGSMTNFLDHVSLWRLWRLLLLCGHLCMM